jgi:hypothetical protein
MGASTRIGARGRTYGETVFPGVASALRGIGRAVAAGRAASIRQLRTALTVKPGPGEVAERGTPAAKWRGDEGKPG